MAAHNTRPVTPLVPLDAPESGIRAWVGKIARAVNLILGKVGTTTVTLTASATSTTLYDSRIGYFSHIQLSPQTADAAQSLVMGIWITCGDGQAIINHVNFDAVDQTFSVLIVNL